MNHSAVISKVEQQAGCILGDIRRLLLGLSGGADSVALLLALLHLGREVRAVHCNFHLRGEESDRDMAFCMDLCARLGVGLEVVHFDVPGYMRAHGVSTEVACRELRYGFFRERMAAAGCDRIAVAHHADDNIETMLLNLFRGGGISGLRGMLPDSNGVIRPLLTVTRSEILEYLRDCGEDYIVDSSNLESDYRRNYIRNELLPMIEERWPGVRKAITGSIANLRSDERMLDAVRERALEELSDSDVLPYSVLKASPSPEWLLHQWLKQYGAKANVAREIAGHLQGGRPANGKRWNTPRGMVVATRTSLKFTGKAL